MSKRITPEARIIDFFMTAPIENVESMLNTVTAILNSRKPKAKAAARKRTNGSANRKHVPTAPPEPISKAV